LLHCDCQPHDTRSFSPLAQVLPERTTPELLFLETKWGISDELRFNHAPFARGPTDGLAGA
jgi:hypothetical protein